MAVVYIILVLIFSAVMYVVEVPKMLQCRQYRELWTFLILIALGAVLVILKSLDIKIPNPSDFVMWVYSPVRDVMKALLK